MNSIYNTFLENGVEMNDTSSLRPLEDIILRTIKTKGFEVARDAIYDEGAKLRTINYSIIMDSIIIYPLSFRYCEQYLTDTILLNDNHPRFVINKPIDKYKSNPCNKDIDKLVVLPGSNILKEIVSRDKLLGYAEDEDIFVKLHPLTTIEDISEIKTIFNDSNVLAPETSLYSVYEGLKEVYTTPSSEICMYAALDGKKLHNICTENRDSSSVKGYDFLTEKLFYSTNPKQLLERIIFSSMSCVISKYDIRAKEKIHNFLTYIELKQKEITW
jgi:hypothetical protein